MRRIEEKKEEVITKSSPVEAATLKKNSPHFVTPPWAGDGIAMAQGEESCTIHHFVLWQAAERSQLE